MANSAGSYEYICYIDDDVFFCDQKNLFEKLVEDLKFNYKIDAVVVPCLQLDGIPDQVITPVNADAAVGSRLKSVGHKLDTFNCMMMRTFHGYSFEEEFFGNQTLDIDFGWQVSKAGKFVMADCSTALAHTQTSFKDKNLFYHAVVARNTDILFNKWANILSWKGVEHFNKENPNLRIPSLEEISHMNEENLFLYICKLSLIHI